jgi:hypothetical protein
MEAAGSYTVSHPRTPLEYHVFHRDYIGYNVYTKQKLTCRFWYENCCGEEGADVEKDVERITV